MDQIFLQAVEKVLEFEGGYSNHPHDKGGQTRYGISSRSYPHLDIQNLTKQQAIEIYYTDWWQRYNYQLLPTAIAEKLFDTAINMGSYKAHLYAQRALRACGFVLKEDGILGNNTRQALKQVNANTFLAAYKAECANHYRRLTEYNASQQVFLKGWLRRAYS